MEATRPLFKKSEGSEKQVDGCVFSVLYFPFALSNSYLIIIFSNIEVKNWKFLCMQQFLKKNIHANKLY